MLRGAGAELLARHALPLLWPQTADRRRLHDRLRSGVFQGRAVRALRADDLRPPLAQHARAMAGPASLRVVRQTVRRGRRLSAAPHETRLRTPDDRTPAHDP